MSFQVTFSPGGRPSICAMSFSLRPLQQIVRSVDTSPLGMCESESAVEVRVTVYLLGKCGVHLRM